MLWSPSSEDLGEAAWTAVESAGFDLHLQQDLGIPSDLLMENAAAALALQVRRLCASEGLRRVLFVAGPGNNGGDALVAARHLAGLPQLEVHWQLPGGPAKPDTALDAAASVLGRLVDSGALPDAALPPEKAELIVDGMFGIGLARALEGAWLERVERLNASPAPILAVDVPSGLDATRGESLGDAVRADWTLSFVGPKRGFERADGPRTVGEVRCADIGVHRAYARRWLASARATARS